jgi:hypothetical protein
MWNTIEQKYTNPGHGGFHNGSAVLLFLYNKEDRIVHYEWFLEL